MAIKIFKDLEKNIGFMFRIKMKFLFLDMQKKVSIQR